MDKHTAELIYSTRKALEELLYILEGKVLSDEEYRKLLDIMEDLENA